MDAKIPCNYHTGVQYDYLGMYPEQASLALLALNDTCIHNTNLSRLEVEVKSGRGPQSDPPRLPRFTVRSFHPWIHLCPANWLKFSTDRVCVPATFGTKFGIRGKIHHSPSGCPTQRNETTTPKLLSSNSISSLGQASVCLKKQGWYQANNSSNPSGQQVHCTPN